MKYLTFKLNLLFNLHQQLDWSVLLVRQSRWSPYCVQFWLWQGARRVLGQAEVVTTQQVRSERRQGLAVALRVLWAPGQQAHRPPPACRRLRGWTV